ncbi:MAG TPA: glycosyltransferase family 2 protein [Burkholderiaceae bacterium]|jgi:succinoglycan biosynthesis protein ExoW
MANKIAVVIPYYQERSGILYKAVTSALAQDVSAKMEIIVVDDSSPVPAHGEIGILAAQHPGQIKIIVQKNGGPAAARNMGLANVAPDTTYVAFLDSDDTWIDSHLSNALTALDAGFDFYFTDHFQLHQSVSAFNRAKRIQVSEHREIDAHAHLREFSGNMFDQILIGNIIGTSTVVYRYSKFPGLRFREEFICAGEDYLFWLDLVTKTEKIAFSSLCECTYGEGVNIFAGSGWGSERSLHRIHHELKFKKALGKNYSLNSTQKKVTSSAITHLRASFVAEILHRIARRRKLERSLLQQHFLIDPQSFIYFIPLAISNVVKRMI